MLDNIKKEFSTRTLVLIPIAIAINIAVGELVVRDEEIRRRRLCHARLPYVLDNADHLSVGNAADPARTQRHLFAKRFRPQILARERSAHHHDRLGRDAIGIR